MTKEQFKECINGLLDIVKNPKNSIERQAHELTIEFLDFWKDEFNFEEYMKIYNEKLQELMS